MPQDNQNPGMMELLRRALVARMGQQAQPPTPAPVPASTSGAGQSLPAMDQNKANLLMAGFKAAR